jgi:acyl-CoA thioester hydrolase
LSGPFRHQLRVRYNECDPQGVVFNANYLTYFDITITELWREAMGSWNEVVAAGADMVVAEVGIRYRGALRFDDEFEALATISALGNSSMTASIVLERDGETVTEGEIRYVAIDPKAGGKAPIPDKVREALQPYLSPAPGHTLDN